MEKGKNKMIQIDKNVPMSSGGAKAMIQIDKNIPIPDKQRTYKKRMCKYPFETLDIGDSFVYCLTDNDHDRRVKSNSACALALHWSKKLKRSHCVRTTDGVVRIWRAA